MRFELYRRLTLRGWRWFWRLQAANNRSIAVGGEGYHNRADARATIELVQGSVHVRIVEEGR